MLQDEAQGGPRPHHAPPPARPVEGSSREVGARAPPCGRGPVAVAGRGGACRRRRLRGGGGDGGRGPWRAACRDARGAACRDGGGAGPRAPRLAVVGQHGRPLAPLRQLRGGAGLRPRLGRAGGGQRRPRLLPDQRALARGGLRRPGRDARPPTQRAPRRAPARRAPCAPGRLDPRRRRLPLHDGALRRHLPDPLPRRARDPGRGAAPRDPPRRGPARAARPARAGHGPPSGVHRGGRPRALAGPDRRPPRSAER